MHFAKLTFAVLLTVGVVFHPARGVERQDFKVNDDNGSAEQNNPRLAVSGDGGFAVVWVDRRSGAADIYMQRFGNDGFAIGSNKLVNDDAGDAYQTEAAIAVDLTGKYSAVWKDYRNGSYPFDPDIYFQRYDTSLTASGSNRLLTSEGADNLKETPDLALSHWGGGLVVWADYRNNNWDVYGQLVASNGSLIGSNFKVNDDAGAAQQHAPRVAVSPEGWYAVAWYDSRNGNDDIYAQCYDSLGVALGANLKVNADSSTARQAFPDVATDGRGHFTVVWVDWRNGNYPANPDIYSRKFNLDLSPVTDDQMVNQDGSKRAQREPSIAADRRGNVAIIWSDSSASSWDIRGQMIDVDGVIREANFQANSAIDSAQLQPDVALDGRYRYITWADKRKGHFDIYASITKYNDPSLTAEPSSLHFEMLEGGALPAAQDLDVEHTGYNPINFNAVSSHSWLAVTPGSAVTPQTLSVYVTTDTLSYGTYFAELALYDRDNDDTSAVVAVRLDVTAPILEFSSDSLYLRAFAGVDDSVPSRVIITNAGAGDLNWTATDTCNWLDFVPPAGGEGDTLALWASALDLGAGVYTAQVVVDAGEVVNSPGTIKIVFDVVADLPYLRVEPEGLYIATTDPAAIDTALSIYNAGAGILNWTAYPAASWLNLNQFTGFGNASVGLTVDTTGFGYGYYESYIDFVDSASFNIGQRIPVTIDYLEPGSDTVEIGSAHVTVGESGQFPLVIKLVNNARDIRIPVEYDTSLLVVDSVVFNPGLPGDVTGSYLSEWGYKSVIVDLASETTMGGEVYIGDVFFTAGSAEGISSLTETSSSALSAVVTTPEGDRLHPVVLDGEIRIDASTGVDDGTTGAMPARFALAQNYPNPFNPSTTIEFALPERSTVVLEVFNILGQRVRTLLDEDLPAGEHSLLWNGDFENGRPCPSGIYFYRLRTGDHSLVRKMALVK